MAIQKELWLNTIQENLFKGFASMRMAASDDSAFVNGKTIHVPNAGAPAGIARNNTTYPATISERVDTDLTYDLASFQVKPIRLGWSDLLQLSYPKMQSVLNDAMGGLDEAIKNWVCSQWWTHNSGATDRLISTSHATKTETNWLGGSATGSLKALQGSDLRMAWAILTKEKFPASDRYCILDTVMFRQLLDDVAYNASRLEVVQGLTMTVDNVYGFKVIEFPFVAAVSANTGTVTTIEPSDVDGTFSFTANNRPIGLCFHKSAVSFAWTVNQIFSEEGKAAYYGDIISAEIYGGGKYRRTDGKGVVAIRATA